MNKYDKGCTHLYTCQDSYQGQRFAVGAPQKRKKKAAGVPSVDCREYSPNHIHTLERETAQSGKLWECERRKRTYKQTQPSPWCQRFLQEQLRKKIVWNDGGFQVNRTCNLGVGGDKPSITEKLWWVLGDIHFTVMQKCYLGGRFMNDIVKMSGITERYGCSLKAAGIKQGKQI